MVIVEGAVEVRRKGRKINELGAGGFIGEMALISKAPRNATVTTSQDSSLLVVSDRAFWGLLERVPRSGDERDQSVGRAPAAPRHLSSVSISGPMCAYSSVLTVATTIAV